MRVVELWKARVTSQRTWRTHGGGRGVGGVGHCQSDSSCARQRSRCRGHCSARWWRSGGGNGAGARLGWRWWLQASQSVAVECKGGMVPTARTAGALRGASVAHMDWARDMVSSRPSDGGGGVLGRQLLRVTRKLWSSQGVNKTSSAKHRPGGYARTEATTKLNGLDFSSMARCRCSTVK